MGRFIPIMFTRTDIKAPMESKMTPELKAVFDELVGVC